MINDDNNGIFLEGKPIISSSSGRRGTMEDQINDDYL